MSDDYKPTYDIYGIPKPPDPSLWKKGVCTSYPGSPYGCACPKCNREMIEDLDRELGTAPAPAGGEVEPTFEDFLKGQHASGYAGLDDNMPESYDAWIATFDYDEWLTFGTIYAGRQRHNASKTLAAAEARVRAEVWREIYRVAQNAPVMRTDNGQQLGKEFVLDEIREAAIEYGIDLTSLAKPE